MVLIALCGPHNSGKETIARYLTNKYNFTYLSFYETIMKVCKELFLLTDEEMKKENRNKPIRLLKNATPKELGKSVMFALNSNIELEDDKNKNIRLSILTWNMIRKVISLKNTNVVISDVRYRQEEMMLHRLGVKVIKIDRDGCEYDEDENKRLIYDYTILNSSSIDHLLLEADRLICSLIVKENTKQN